MLAQIINFINHVRMNKKGQGMVEYALIIGLIAVVVIVVLATLGGDIANLFKGISGKITGVATETSGS